MSSLAADVTFDFTFPQCHPATTPPPPAPFYDFESFEKNPALLDVPYYGASRAGHGHGHGHGRSSSNCSAYSSYSAYSFASTPSEQSFLSAPSVVTTPVVTPAATPARSQIRTHGPLLLPKIRSQDQVSADDDASYADNTGLLPAPPLKRARTSPTPARSLSRTPSLPPRSRRSVSASARRSTLGTHTYPSPGAALSRHQPSHSLSQPMSQSMSQSFPLPSFHMTPNRASTPSSVFEATPPPPSLLCSGLDAADTADHVDKFDYDYAFAPYPGTIPANFLGAAQWDYAHEPSSLQTLTREDSPLSVASASPPPPETVVPLHVPQIAMSLPVAAPAQTTLAAYLSQQNPAPALVHTVAYPLRDPNAKHYWWDVRQVRAWSAFSAASLVALPGADAVLGCRVALSLLPAPTPARHALHPETESDLHALCAAHYLPRVNAALALSSPRPVQLAARTSAEHGTYFAGATAADTAAPMGLFGGGGGCAAARVVGLVKSFDRFNTGMRVEGGATNNIKKVEYLRGLAHLHHLMREHSCRYGFILTEIELVVVRNGVDATPLFGQMEVASVPLATFGQQQQQQYGGGGDDNDNTNALALTANLALWGLCMLASDEMAAAAAQQQQQSSSAPVDKSSTLLCSYATHIGAPAEGTRRKAAERDAWMPPPQLSEKRGAKRARGWVMPEDAVVRKEMGRRGVKY